MTEEEEAAEVLRAVFDPTQKPGFELMMQIGNALCALLQIVQTTEHKFDVDLYEESVHDFIITMHWGKFIVHHRVQRPEVLWSLTLLNECESCNTVHEIELPFITPDLPSLLTMAFTTLIAERARGVFGPASTGKIH